MRSEHLQRIWFAGWNGDIERARAEYDLVRMAETDHGAQILLAKAYAEADQRDAAAEGQAPPPGPKLCRNKLHEMTPENTADVARCIKCRDATVNRCYNDRQARKRAARGRAA